MDAKTLALGTHLLGTIRGACPEPLDTHSTGSWQGSGQAPPRGSTPEKQDHSTVVEPSLVKAMALLKGMTVLEVAAEKGIRGANRVLVDLVGRVAQVMREVEYPAGLDAMTAWEKSMAPMDI